jgi:hypothetical protein
MARVALAYSNLAVNANLSDPAGTATVAGAGNGLSIPDISPNRRQSVPELTLLRVSNASGGTGTISVLAGALPLDAASGQGPLTVSVPTATTVWLGPFESGRFIQATGELVVESSVVMTVTAFNVPRH